MRYDPLPARMVTHRRRLRFVYFDGSAPRLLSLGEVRELTTAKESVTPEETVAACKFEKVQPFALLRDR